MTWRIIDVVSFGEHFYSSWWARDCDSVFTANMGYEQQGHALQSQENQLLYIVSILRANTQNSNC